MMVQHRVLIIGVGSIGERHVRCFQQTRRAEMSLIDIDASLATQVAQRYGLTAHATLDLALQAAPTAAVIATPAHLHSALARRLVEQGLHVLIEKPLDVTLAGIDELQRAAAGRQRTVGLAYVYRCHPVLIALRQAVLAHRFGRPQELIAVSGQHFPTYRPAYHQTYYAQHATGGGAIQDALTHVFDAAAWLVGPVNRLVCDAAHQALPGVQVEDTVHVLARHGDLPATYALNQHQAPNEMAITLVCEQGTLRGEFHLNRWIWMTRPASTWTIEEFGPLERDTLFVAQANAFLDAVENKAPIPCSLDDGLHTLRINLAALQSAATGTWQTVGR